MIKKVKTIVAKVEDVKVFDEFVKASVEHTATLEVIGTKFGRINGIQFAYKSGSKIFASNSLIKTVASGYWQPPSHEIFNKTEMGELIGIYNEETTI